MTEKENTIIDKEENKQVGCQTEDGAAVTEEAAVNCDSEVKREVDGASDCEKQHEGKSESAEKKKSFFSKKQGDAENKKLTEENIALKKANEEMKERYMRLAAEYENYKRRTAKEMETKYNDVKCDTLKNMLPVVDNFERALKVSVPDGCEAYSDGVKMIYDQLIAMLTSNGIEEINALGEVFDPAYHYAVMHAEDENMGENVIAEVFEKGYRMGDKVLRYSMVKVVN